MLILLDVTNDALAQAVIEAGRVSEAIVRRWPSGGRAWPSGRNFMLFTDGDYSTVIRHGADLMARRIDPRRTIVRAIEAPRSDWVYHDLPVFASVKSPESVPEAAALIQRLHRARIHWVGQYPEISRPPATLLSGIQTDEAPRLDLESEAERLITVAERTDLKVLLIGETGTGKTSIARRVHASSGRRGAFVSLNCAALPETLIESELFGVEAGAFTGAQKSRPGKFELANEGTLFLDEIDSLPIHLQSKLLSAIQDAGTTRLGDHKFRPSSFRLITASQRALDDMVAGGTFRSDLYHRVAVIVISLPPVRHIGAKILVVFEQLLRAECQRLGVPIPATSPALYSAILSHDWPGNFRELETAAQRFAAGLPILPTSNIGSELRPTLRSQLQAFERVLIGRALARSGGNLKVASEELSLPLETLRYRIRSLGLLTRKDDSRGNPVQTLYTSTDS